MSVKLLAVGDLHIGRLPSRLPEAISGRAIDYSPAAAWEQVVDKACDEGVDAVLLGGDVVESTHDFFEALPRLQSGITRLAAAGIRVLAVSGNHDVEVLPRLAARIPECELLGVDGQWQRAEITGSDGQTVSVWGWSFPALEVTQRPLAHFPGRAASHPSIGLLHCDRDQTDSRYAPVSSRELANAGLDAWLLAHIHRPDALSPDRPHGYLGSVVGLDAGEPGPRGPWLLQWEAGRLTRFEQRPVGKLRWERMALDVTGLADSSAVEGALADALQALGRQLDANVDPAEVIAVRLSITGETHLTNDQITALLPDSSQLQALAGQSQRQWFIERCQIDAKPFTPLEVIARRNDQPGLLAQRLLMLQSPAGDPERETLIDTAMPVAERAINESRWRDLPGEAPDREQVAEWLRERGYDALRAMLAGEAE